MKAKMSISVRVKLSAMLARDDLEGDSARFLMFRELREKLSLSEEEQKLVGYQSVDEGHGFRSTYIEHQEKDPLKEIEVGEIITEIICKEIGPLEKMGKLKQAMYDLFLWFKPEIDKMRKMEQDAVKNAASPPK